MTHRKKLIEVALPLDIINAASAREKSIRHGHPSTLHLWWARRPLAACRAVLFASLIDDPGEHPDQFPTEQDQERERTRLFKLIEKLVKWENSNNEKVLKEIREEIARATNNNPPSVLDPFAGGGSIPLEAQRLGLEAHASDLNPVAVLINKALIEIPPKFANQPPVNPEARKTLMEQEWRGAHGLANDIRYYGKWMRDEAEKRIGHLYPKVTLPNEHGGGEATVIAWLWARTVTCPNPACDAQMPLIRSFWLSKKKGKETWVEPSIDRAMNPPAIKFTVHEGKGHPQQDGTVNRQGATCIACGIAVPFDYIRNEGKAGNIGEQLMAIVAEGKNGRAYLSPQQEQIEAVNLAHPTTEVPETALPVQALSFRVQLYGMTRHRDLFTRRQLMALTHLSDLIQETRERVLADAQATNITVNDVPLRNGGTGANAYADVISTYLAIALDKGADYWSTICSWHTGRDTIGHTFVRQALPMVWDFAEANPFSGSSGNFLGAAKWVAEAIEDTLYNANGEAIQRDAAAFVNGITHPLISTDPPYYDNIGYADLSDYFYIWLRRSLLTIYPDLFGTMLVPKEQELIATPFRFGGDKEKAREFFEKGLSKTFERLRAIQNPDYPLTVYYAFKQADAEEEEPKQKGKKSGKSNGSQVVASTGWETMLEGLIRSGFMITGTLPMRTEMMNRSVGQDTNALASSIVLVCRPRPIDARIASRREFLTKLRNDLPDALKKLQHGGIAPVDLAQASIGPGMAVYSEYSRVIESDGTPLTVRTALQLINRTLDEVLAEQEGEYDAETRWAIAWFEQYAMNAGEYGQAETLSKAKNIAIERLREAGLLESKSGKVRLLTREELAAGRQPHAGATIWEVVQRLIHALLNAGGEVGAGGLLQQAGEQAEAARDLAYRLYTVCERKGWSEEARAYNSLVMAWSGIAQEARRQASQTTRPASLWEETTL